MSASQCIKCEDIVGGYQKYCDNCVNDFGVQQDENWHRTSHWLSFDWDIARKAEFEKDLEHAKKHKQAIKAKQLEQKEKQRGLCISGCGRSVLKGHECRKCKRKRIHGGLKHVKNLEKQRKLVDFDNPISLDPSFADVVASADESEVEGVG